MANIQTIRERWQQAQKVAGLENVLTLADGTTVRGRYWLTECGAVTASHNALGGFTMSAGFPTDGNGGSCNDRDYQRDRDAQRITREIARCYDSRAIQSPVVVSQDGVVLSGNGRTMAGEIAAHDGTDGEYIDYLATYGGAYGFAADVVGGFAHPRLVFVLDDALPYTPATFARFNAQETKTQSKAEKAVKLGKLVQDDVFSRILATINAFETLGDFYAQTEAATGCLQELLRAGVIDAMSYAEYYDGDTISTAGREILENVLIGKAFAADPDCGRMITTYKSLRRSVVFALAEVVSNLTLGNDYTLNRELTAAVNLAYIARQHGYKAGERVSEYARQMDAFSGETVSDYKDVVIMTLADALNGEQVTLLKRIMAVYNHQAQESAAGQLDMFSAGGVKTKVEILEEVKAIFAKGSTQDQREAEKQAVEARTAANIFVTEEQATKVMEGGYVEYTTFAGDVIVCQVESIKRGIAYLIAKGGCKLWCSVRELTATADHRLSLPVWLEAGAYLTDGKTAIQRVEAIADGYVSFEWINGGVFDLSLAVVLQSWRPSASHICQIIEAA